MLYPVFQQTNACMSFFLRNRKEEFPFAVQFHMVRKASSLVNGCTGSALPTHHALHRRGVSFAKSLRCAKKKEICAVTKLIKHFHCCKVEDKSTNHLIPYNKKWQSETWQMGLFWTWNQHCYFYFYKSEVFFKHRLVPVYRRDHDWVDGAIDFPQQLASAKGILTWDTVGTLHIVLDKSSRGHFYDAHWDMRLCRVECLPLKKRIDLLQQI